MAIAPSKLGYLVRKHWDSDDALIHALRDLGLVMFGSSDDDLEAVFERARQEHAALGEGARLYNSPNERVRVFLDPYLTSKGRQWAVPLDSLNLPD